MFTNAQKLYWAEEITGLVWDHHDGKVPGALVENRAIQIVENIIDGLRRAEPPLVPHVTPERMAWEQIDALGKRLDSHTDAIANLVRDVTGLDARLDALEAPTKWKVMCSTFTETEDGDVYKDKAQAEATLNTWEKSLCGGTHHIEVVNPDAPLAPLVTRIENLEDKVNWLTRKVLS